MGELIKVCQAIVGLGFGWGMTLAHFPMLSESSATAQGVINPSLMPKLTGKWSAINPENATERALLIFTPQGEVYRLEVLSDRSQPQYRLLTPLPSKYQIIRAAKAKPTLIEIKSSNNPYVGIWELVNDRQLKLKQISSNSHRHRFTQTAMILTKIDDDPTIPPNLEKIDNRNNSNPNPQKPETIAQINLKLINRVQIVYRQKHDRFAPNFDRLRGCLRTPQIV
jgi:hypothetical protein